MSVLGGFELRPYGELASIYDRRRGRWLLDGMLLPRAEAVRWAARMAAQDDADRALHLARAAAAIDADKLLRAATTRPVKAAPTLSWERGR